MTSRISVEQLWAMDGAGLHDVLAAGHRIDEDSLVDRVYRGVSLGLPSLVERLTWKQFQKVFTREAGQLRGWNVRLVQNGLDGDDHAKERRGARFTFGHFHVRPTTQSDHPRARGRRVAIDRALMLDYGAGGNGLDPIAAMRDPIVAVNIDDAHLILGWSYLQVGPLAIPTPSFFTLEDAGPRDHLAHSKA